MKAKQSVYIVTMQDGKTKRIETRAELTKYLGETAHSKIDQIYRAVPMSFQTQTVTRLVADRPVVEEAKGGSKDNPSKAT